MSDELDVARICADRLVHMAASSQPLSEFLDGIPSDKRRRDAETMIDLMERVTGQPARLHGSIVGFGQYHYEYESGRKGDGPAAAFSPRKAATTIYLMDGVESHADLLSRLGPHTTGVGCLYIKDLDSVDLSVLQEVVGRSYARLTSGKFTQRARERSAPEGDTAPS